MPDPTEQRILDDIEKHGWSAIVVPADCDSPGFEYSIGIRHTFGHPDLIVFGLGREAGHAILWAVFRAIQQGARFSDGATSDAILDSFPCVFRTVSEENHIKYLGYAMWHRRHIRKSGTLDALQLVWPDKDGLFPWEIGADQGCSTAQPCLWST